jgi:histone H3/H4
MDHSTDTTSTPPVTTAAAKKPKPTKRRKKKKTAKPSFTDIPSTTIKRCIKEYTGDISPSIRWEESAKHVLHFETEAMMREAFRNANRVTQNKGKETMNPEDLNLAMQLTMPGLYGRKYDGHSPDGFPLC